MAATGPPCASESWLQRFAWMDQAGARWWPFFGAVYFLVAVKRVRGMTLLSPAWRCAQNPGQCAGFRGQQRGSEPRWFAEFLNRMKDEVKVLNPIDIYTDGACKGNPGPGGWGALLKSADAQKGAVWR